MPPEKTKVRGECRSPPAMGFLAYVAVTWRVFLLSRSVFGDLIGLNFVPVSAYIDRRIPATSLVILFTQNAAITLVACYLILATPRDRMRREVSPAVEEVTNNRSPQ